MENLQYQSGLGRLV